MSAHVDGVLCSVVQLMGTPNWHGWLKPMSAQKAETTCNPEERRPFGPASIGTGGVPEDRRSAARPGGWFVINEKSSQREEAQWGGKGNGK
jgi:hypothetical protein